MTRNRIYKVVSILMVASILVFCLIPSRAIAESTAVNGDSSIDVAYDYPVKVGTNEWYKLETIHDKIAACQIPEDILQRLSTEALIETIRNYPLSVNIYAYDTIDMGYEKVKSQFNAIEELENRIKSNEGNSRQLLQVAANKVLTKSQNATFEDCFIDTIKGCIDIQVLEKTPRAVSLRGTSTSVTTPKGSSVPAIKSLTWNDHYVSSGGSITQARTQTAHDRVKNTYGSVTVVRGISPSYNCHSYAWHSTSTTNTYWINNPSKYVTDGSYRAASTYAVGRKLLYGTPGNNPEHSAIISAVSENHLTYVTSKWGCMGLYKHLYFDCPYSSGVKAYIKS